MVTLFGRILALALCLVATSAGAQYYNIHTWESFESGMPTNLSLGHQADSTSAMLFPYSTPGTAPQILEGVAALECGNFGLGIFPTAEKKHLSVFSPASLERSRLGATGRALYQADLYLPAANQPVPFFALLAAMPTKDNKLSYEIYRFGIMEGGKKLFFSFIRDNLSQPVIFVMEPLKGKPLKRPGWHRFQIIFAGQTDIICAVDQVPTAFSPIHEGTLTRLNPGLMVTYSKTPAPCLADNLSIQWSPDDVPLPVSPWVTKPIPEGTNLIGDGSPLQWFNNPKQGWTVASAQKRPMLVLFYAPNVLPYQYLQSICPNDNGARDFLNKHVLIRVDANQLAGGTLAQKMKVQFLPTLLLLGPRGEELGRVTVKRGETKWETLVTELNATTDATAAVKAAGGA